jgi:hypothetical protein
MSEPCSTYVVQERVHTEFWWGNLRGRVHFEDPVVNERIILRGIFRKWNESMD